MATLINVFGNNELGKNALPNINKGTPKAATREFTSSMQRANCVPKIKPSQHTYN